MDDQLFYIVDAIVHVTIRKREDALSNLNPEDAQPGHGGENSAELCKTPSALLLRTTSKASVDEQATPEQLQEPRPPCLDITDEEAETVVDEVESPGIPHSSASCCSITLSEMSCCSDCEEEAESPPQVESGRFLRGTRILVGGWFQACRGCNELTSRTLDVGQRELPLCGRCQTKFRSMSAGEFPTSAPQQVHGKLEPLCLWLPRLLAPQLPMQPEQRSALCDQLLLLQDDAWQALASRS